jgi:DNA polymerase-3 subunit alpha
VVEALIKAGAFDALHADRASALASVALAFDWAEAQEVNALQGGLFDFGPDEPDVHGSSTQEPALAHAEPLGLRDRLMLEKAALGFYLSGHLFDEHGAEVRRFVRKRIADLADSREPVLLAGIVAGLKLVNGQRGRAAIFRLDDGTDAIEAVVNNEAILEAQRELLSDDSLLIAQGKVQLDRFSGGLRFNVQQVWDLPAARARFGRYLMVAIGSGLPPVEDVLKTWPVKRLETEHGELAQGLSIRMRIQRSLATAELDLGDDARFWPCDEALARWRQLAQGGQAQVVYETA